MTLFCGGSSAQIMYNKESDRWDWTACTYNSHKDTRTAYGCEPTRALAERVARVWLDYWTGTYLRRPAAPLAMPMQA